LKFLSHFFRKQREEAREEQVADDFFTLFDEMRKDSPVERATQSVQKASAALALGDLNTAWAYYQEAKEHYMDHAIQCRCTPAQVIDLDSSMSAPLANILRLENKHYDALCHIIYWAVGTERPMKMHDQQVSSYFKRCKFNKVVLEDVTSFVAVSRFSPDFVRIRDTIGAWRDAE
jgi:hypothetical protein